jgi:hypothetical protein
MTVPHIGIMEQEAASMFRNRVGLRYRLYIEDRWPGEKYSAASSSPLLAMEAIMAAKEIPVKSMLCERAH